MKKIALLSGYTLHIGGVESHLLSLIHHSPHALYDWCLIAPASPYFISRASTAQLIDWQLSHVLDVWAAQQLSQVLRHHRVQLLHIHSPNAAFVGMMAARFVGIPSILTVHLPAYYLTQNKIKRGLYQVAEFLLQRLASQVIYVSSHVQQEALALGIAPRHSLAIENGIEVERYTPRTLRSPAAPLTLCYVGRLEPQKGVDVLLRAVALLATPQLRVRLAGDGSQRGPLTKLAAELQIDAQVEFMGFCDEVPQLLTASDIFVLPSRYEALSIALLEAMASGLPCVATNVGENATLIANEQEGLLVPPDDPSALAHALNLLLTDASLRDRLGQAARLKAEQYSARHMAERTFAVYEALLSR